jgi:BON domain
MIKKVILVAVVLSFASQADAQIFDRLKRRIDAEGAPSGNLNDVGKIKGDERFLRENRGKEDFVGQDSSERRSFVGSLGETGGPVQLTTAGLRIETSESANVRFRAATRRRNVMYDPKLEIDFKFNGPKPDYLADKLERRLKSTPRLDNPDWPLEISVQGSTATLFGAVATEHARRLSELVVLLEPGVEKVHNHLSVDDRLEPAKLHRH